MSMLVEFAFLVTSLIGLLIGSGCIYWAKVRPTARRAAWGRRLFIVTLLVLGLAGLIAALIRADGLAPLGLLSGLLIVGMLWESPLPASEADM